MGAGHMTVLQLHRPMAFHVLQWCHPMLASIKEDKLLYPDDHLIGCSKVDSGPRITPKIFLSGLFTGGLQGAETSGGKAGELCLWPPYSLFTPHENGTGAGTGTGNRVDWF